MKKVFGDVLVMVLLLGVFFGAGSAEESVENETLCTLASLNKFVEFKGMEDFASMGCGFLQDLERSYYSIFEYSGSIEELDQVIVETFVDYSFKGADTDLIEGMITKFFNEKGGVYLELLNGDGKEVGLYIRETEREGIFYVEFFENGIEKDFLYRPYLDQNVASWYLNFDLAGNWFEDYAVVREWFELSWQDGEMMNRSITFDVGDDFESLRELVFSNEYIFRYGNFLTEAPLQNIMEGGMPSLVFTTIDGLTVRIGFDEEQREMVVSQIAYDVSIPLNEYGNIEQEPLAVSEIRSVYDLLGEGVNPFEGFYLEEYADNFDLVGYEIEILPYGKIDFRVIYLVDGIDSAEVGVAISDWQPTVKTNYDWYLNKTDFDLYGENMYVTGHNFLLNEKDLFLDAFEMNYVPELFEFGMLEGISERDDYYFTNVQFAKDDVRTVAYIIHELGDDYSAYYDYILSEAYQSFVETNGGVDFSIFKDDYKQTNVTYSVGEILVKFTFYDQYEDVAISESTMVAETDLRDLVK